ncbi:DUF1178 family protein [Yunchengibacter salinarum]|uniref:DUF1178 family protein n=1 Tax=Yunchengibacter salinarum TaxID=3133399 RepID=UPI0035B57B37
MISFDLKCDRAHRFEGWFRSSADYESQKARGLISCPECHSHHVEKALMAPNVAPKGNRRAEPSAPSFPPSGERSPESSFPESPLPESRLPDSPASGSAPSSAMAGGAEKGAPHGEAAPDSPAGQPDAADVRRFFRAVRAHVESSFDNVGRRFADEARKIHYGESEKRGIYGQASEAERRELAEEGVDVLPLPDVPKDDA